MSHKYNEVEFKRVETRDSLDQITVSFERVRVIKQVACTQAQADTLNAGKIANSVFTLLLKPDEPDPAPQVLKTQKENRADRANIKFNRPSRLGDMLP